MSNRIGFYIVVGLNLFLITVFGLYLYRIRMQAQYSSQPSYRDLFFHYSLEDLKLSQDIVLSPLSGESLTMETLVADEYTYAVLWINARSCQSCTDEALTAFTELTTKNGINNRIILASFYMPRELSLILKERKIDIPVYVPEAIPINVFEALNKISNPVIFILDSHFIIKSAFIPLKDDRQRSIVYFQVIADRYFNSGHL